MSHVENERSSWEAPSGVYQRGRQVIFIVLAAWLLLGIPSIFLFLPWSDYRDQQWVSCQVVSVEAEQTSDDESWQVVLESPDCPVMFIADGVHEANAQPIASAIVPGVYDLRVHESVLESGRVMQGQAPVEVHAHMLVQETN